MTRQTPGGRPSGAYEIVADAKDAKSSALLLLYQVVVPDGKGYWLVQGIVAAERADEWLPVFRRITESIETRDAEWAAPAGAAGDRTPPPTKEPETKPAPAGNK